MILISNEYIVTVATFSQCVLLFELKAWEYEWFVAIKVLHERKRKEKKVPKKGRRKKNDIVCEYYTNVCKLGASWDRQDFQKPCKLITHF